MSRDRCQQLESSYQELIASFGPLFLGAEKDLQNQRPTPDSWSFLECMMHLVLTARPYIEPLEGLDLDKSSEAEFSKGILYRFVNRQIISLSESKRKFKAPKFLQPEFRQYESSRVCQDLAGAYQELMAVLVKIPDDVFLAKTKIKIPAFPILKLSLEQVFLMHLMHGRRHLEQAIRAAEKASALGTVPFSSRKSKWNRF